MRELSFLQWMLMLANAIDSTIAADLKLAGEAHIEVARRPQFNEASVAVEVLSVRND
jgi:hypothetical protein